MRKEYDVLGEVTIPEDSYYGVFTKRALSNFPKEKNLNKELRDAMADVKKACAIVNEELGLLKNKISNAIQEACNEIKIGKFDKWLVVDPLSGGAGTTVNMNFNEVIANRATQIIGGKLGEYIIHPLHHVNLSQSTNDVYPTAIKIGAIRLLRQLVEKTIDLQTALQEKERKFAGIIKVGRTELQNAVPISVGQEFGAWAEAIARDRWRLYKVEERIRFINLGGTAIGTGINAPKAFSFKVARTLSSITGIGLVKSENLIECTQNADVYAEVHGLLKTLAVNIIKISNDIRTLSSDLLRELKLKPVQLGSSIMPGKINPVLLEYSIQTAMKVVSNDVAVNIAVSSGNLELNSFMPIIQDTLYESFNKLINSISVLTRCVKDVEAVKEQCDQNLKSSKSIFTCFVPILGYKKVEQLLKRSESEGVPIKKLLEEEGIAKETIDKALNPSNMIGLGYIPKL